MPTITASDLIGKGYGKIWFKNLERAYGHIRYIVVVGAKSTKKSTDILAYQPLFQVYDNPLNNIIFVRENNTDNSSSTYPNLYKCAKTMGLDCDNGKMGDLWFSQQPLKVIRNRTGQQFMFTGMSDVLNTASVTPPVGAYTKLYVEEASQLTDFEDVKKIDFSLRCNTEQLAKGAYVQLTFALNPWDINSFIYQAFCKGRMPEDEEYMDTHDYQFYCDPDFTIAGLAGKGLAIHRQSFRINEFRDPITDEVAKITKETSPDTYRTFYLGLWGNTMGATYPELSDKCIVTNDDIVGNNANHKPRFQFRDFSIGIDTGLSDGAGKIRKDGQVKSAMVCQLCGLTWDSSKIVALDEFYFTNEGKSEAMQRDAASLGDDIIKWVQQMRVKYANVPTVMKGMVNIFVDSADSEFISILELNAKKYNVTGLRFLPSTKKSIWARVNFEKANLGWGDIFISKSCPNLIREMKDSQKGSSGEPRGELNDHAINAWEYAWAVFTPRITRWKQFEK